MTDSEQTSPEEIARLRWQVARANDLRDQAYAVAEERTRERDQAIRERDAGARALVAALAKVERPRLNCSIPSCWKVVEHVASDGRLRRVEFVDTEADATIEVQIEPMRIEFRSVHDCQEIIESHEIGVVLAALVWAGVKL
jgi:hypothetical protein